VNLDDHRPIALEVRLGIMGITENNHPVSDGTFSGGGTIQTNYSAFPLSRDNISGKSLSVKYSNFPFIILFYNYLRM